MTYLARLKERLAQPNAALPQPFEGFEGDRGTRISQNSDPHLPTFLAEEEERSENQSFTQKKSPTDGGQLFLKSREIRLPDEPSKPSKGSAGADHDDPALWVRKFYNLSGQTAPCPGYRPREWPGIFDAAHDFLERHADQARCLGWSAIELFGVHPVVGGARCDCCGALMLPGGSMVAAVEEGFITLGRNRFYRRPFVPESVLVWEFHR